VEFRILGSLEISGDRGPLELGAPRQQIVLATLLLSANRVVPIDRLIDAIYGDRRPQTARSQAQISISALRRALTANGGGSLIGTHPQGYVITVESGQLDSQRFTELVAAARADRDTGRPGQAVANYREALRLWQGPALAGLDSPLVRLAASHLDEQRIGNNEDRIKLELELGRHRELAGELIELVEEFPLRERLRGQLMLALYRCGRRADALQVYRDGRRVLIDELGMEPDKRLQQLEQAILTSDPVLDRIDGPSRSQPARHLVPQLLPADIGDFTGREEQVRQARRHLLATAGDPARIAVPIVAMDGQGGVGKTSIALHAAHGLVSHFPDGQLFADLHGNSRALTPVEVLGRFLRAFGLSGSQIPDGIEERAEVYRGLLSGRKVLVLLDDAASEAQVAPLLPGSPTAAVLITSRRRLAGLAGAAHVDVDVFDASGSVELFARIAGLQRVTLEPRATAQVTEMCGHLPLALRIAGARLSARPHWSIQQMADRLCDETRRLDELRYGDLAVRASISLSYEGVSEQARRLLRRLAILDAPLISAWVAAALLDEPFSSAQDLLDELVSAHLIEIADDRYRFRDLTRLFARERLAAEEPAFSRKTALERVHASPRRTTKNVTAISTAASATKMPVSMNWNGQNR
jgi:DNA-binding SARP family transcriptional activator